MNLRRIVSFAAVFTLFLLCKTDSLVASPYGDCTVTNFGHDWCETIPIVASACPGMFSEEDCSALGIEYYGGEVCGDQTNPIEGYWNPEGSYEGYSDSQITEHGTTLWESYIHCQKGDLNRFPLRSDP